MKNIEAEVKGNILTLKIDLSKNHGASKSGKSVVIATTEGNCSVPGKEDVIMGVNIYTKK